MPHDLTTDPLVNDSLGSVTEALDTSGNVLATQLNTPYGGQRYGSGTMPTTMGFTGQRLDAITGLYYFGARYYDPQAGQFISADTILPGGGADPWGLSRYAYVEGDPVNAIDPTGHRALITDDGGPGEGYNDGGVPNDPPGTGPMPGAPCDCMLATGDLSKLFSWDEIPDDTWWYHDGVKMWKTGGLGFEELEDGTIIPLDAEGQPLEPGLDAPATDNLGNEYGSEANSGGQDPSTHGNEVGNTDDGGNTTGNNDGNNDGNNNGNNDGNNNDGNNNDGNNNDNSNNSKVKLYRAIGPRELNDLLHYGDYDTSIHGGGKYFATTLEGVQDFVNTEFNAGRQMTITSIEVPQWSLDLWGYYFNDSGAGAGWTWHIAQDFLGEFYMFMGLPDILDPPWIP